MSHPTKSEALLEQFCTSHNIPIFKCVNPFTHTSQEKRKTADYVLLAQGHPIVTEVKQLNQSPEDKTFLRDYASNESSKFMVTEPGRRVRKAIDDAMPQLRETSCGVRPTLLVLYDNTAAHLQRLQPYEVLTGMYGLEQVVIGVPKERGHKAVQLGHKFGPKQKVSTEHNTTLSAVGVLITVQESAQRIDIYHNDYAGKEIQPDWLRANGCHHWRRQPSEEQNSYREWIEI